MFCRHKWNEVKTYEFKNQLTELRGCSMDGFTARDLAKRGVITVVKCEKCGKIEHIKTVFE